MNTYNVYGILSVGVTVRVEAESLEEAIDIAREEFGGVNSYCGNGGSDKLIGVTGTNESIEAFDEEIDFHSAEIAE